MKVVAKTDEYTIYQRRDERFAVQNNERSWVNGDAKVAILVEHKLIAVAAPKPAPEPEPAPPEAEAADPAAGTDEASAAEASADAPADPQAEQ